MDEENEGFEDLTETTTDNSDVETTEENESEPSTETEEDTESGDDSLDTCEVDSLNATITILQTELANKDAEIERWKGINLQLLLEMPNDGTVGTEQEDTDGDDPAPYSNVTGASSLFTTKDN